MREDPIATWVGGVGTVVPRFTGVRRLFLDQRFPIIFAAGSLRKGPLRSLVKFGASGESCPNQHTYVVEKVVPVSYTHLTLPTIYSV